MKPSWPRRCYRRGICFTLSLKGDNINSMCKPLDALSSSILQHSPLSLFQQGHLCILVFTPNLIDSQLLSRQQRLCCSSVTESENVHVSHKRSLPTIFEQEQFTVNIWQEIPAVESVVSSLYWSITNMYLLFIYHFPTWFLTSFRPLFPMNRIKKYNTILVKGIH